MCVCVCVCMCVCMCVGVCVCVCIQTNKILPTSTLPKSGLHFTTFGLNTERYRVYIG